MITSGLLITLRSDPAQAEAAEQELIGMPELTVGQRKERWLPVAAEAEGPRASLDLHDRIQSIPGVEFVDVIQVNFDDTQELMQTREVLS